MMALVPLFTTNLSLENDNVATFVLATSKFELICNHFVAKIIPLELITMKL